MSDHMAVCSATTLIWADFGRCPTVIIHSASLHIATRVCTDIKAEIDDCSCEYISDVARLSKEERSKSLNKIQDLFKKATENSDNKVQIAMQMYEMVSDTHHAN